MTIGLHHREKKQLCIYKNGVETLHGDRNALENKKKFAFFAARGTDATAKGIEKINNNNNNNNKDRCW